MQKRRGVFSVLTEKKTVKTNARQSAEECSRSQVWCIERMNTFVCAGKWTLSCACKSSPLTACKWTRVCACKWTLLASITQAAYKLFCYFCKWTPLASLAQAAYKLFCYCCKTIRCFAEKNLQASCKNSSECVPFAICGKGYCGKYKRTLTDSTLMK